MVFDFLCRYVKKTLQISFFISESHNFVYRIRCNGGNFVTESVSYIQGNQHSHFQYTVIFGHILAFEDDVFGSGKCDNKLDIESLK